MEDQFEARAGQSSREAIDQAQRRVTPYVVTSYLGKAALKLVIGLSISSRPLLIDAIHGLADVVQHILIVWGGRLAHEEPDERYPLGKQPLIDVVALLVGGSILAAGCVAFLSGLSGVLAVTGFPIWFTEILPHPPGRMGEPVWVPGVTMLACAVVSQWVYRLEVDAAREAGAQHLLADAAELGSDRLLEVGLGVGLLAEAVLRRLGGGGGIWASMEALVTPLLLSALGLSVLRLGLSQARESGRRLLNPGLDSGTAAAARRFLTSDLPDGCSMESLIGYRRGPQLHLVGRIAVPHELLPGAQEILRRAERGVGALLSRHAEEIAVRLSATPLYGSEDVNRELGLLVTQVWREPESGIGAQALNALRRGRLLQVRTLAATDEEHGSPLLAWVGASAEQLLTTEADDRSREAFGRVERAAKDHDDPTIRAILTSALLARATADSSASAGSASGTEQTDQALLRCAVEEALRAPAVHPYARAECAFALGYFWANRPAFDAVRAAEYFRASMRSYWHSGFIAEADRLRTVWGHFHTLLHELSPAIILLQEASEVRTLRRDEAGLAEIHGCLGDALGRMGEFGRAEFHYLEDLRLLAGTGQSGIAPHVRGKYGELLVRWGAVLVGQARTPLAEGIQILRLEYRAQESAGRNDFFLAKGLAKGLLHEARRDPAFLAEAAPILDGLVGTGQYKEGFILRLRGRQAALMGDTPGAARLLRESGKRFSGMVAGTGGEQRPALQMLLSDLESARYSIASEASWAQLEEEVERVDGWLTSMSGLTGRLEERARELVRNFARIDAAPSARLAACDRLVALLEG